VVAARPIRLPTMGFTFSGVHHVGVLSRRLS
jgi:hypothetical protein